MAETVRYETEGPLAVVTMVHEPYNLLGPRQWGVVETVDDRAGGIYRVPGPPWKFSADPLDPPGRPAFQGEDNTQVLAEVGYAQEEIADLVAAGALVQAHPRGAARDGARDEQARGKPTRKERSRA